MAQKSRQYEFRKGAAMNTKKRKEGFLQASAKPMHERLLWPGLKAKDHLSRIVTHAVKEAKEARETEVWAEEQIARVLKHIQAETFLSLVFREMIRRGLPIVRVREVSAQDPPKLEPKKVRRRPRRR
jgi:hypothetical protein